MNKLIRIILALSFLAGVLTALGLGSQPAEAKTMVSHGYAYHVVYIYDKTKGHNWPFAQVAESWDNGSGLNLVYRTKPCPSGVACITIKDGNLGPKSEVGQTVNWMSGNQLVNGATITMDRGWAKAWKHKASWRKTAACHEMGHAIGLAHSPSKGSCMYWNIGPSSHAGNGNHADYNGLRQLYGKGR